MKNQTGLGHKSQKTAEVTALKILVSSVRKPLLHIHCLDKKKKQINLEQQNY